MQIIKQQKNTSRVFFCLPAQAGLNVFMFRQSGQVVRWSSNEMIK